MRIEDFIDTSPVTVSQYEEFLDTHVDERAWDYYYIDNLKPSIYNVKHQYLQRDVQRNNRNNYTQIIYKENYKETLDYDIDINTGSPSFLNSGTEGCLYYPDVDHPDGDYNSISYMSFRVKFKEDGIFLALNVDNVDLNKRYYYYINDNGELICQI